MAKPNYRNLIQAYAQRWAWRFVVNLLKGALLTSLLGVIMFALMAAQVLMVTGEGAVSPAASLVQLGPQAFNFMLASVTGDGNFEGDIAALGTLIMTFITPYLAAISITVSLAEALTGRSLFRWLTWSLKGRLLCLMAGFGLLIGLSVFASNVPRATIGYGFRALLLALMGGWAAGLLLLLHHVGRSAAVAFQDFCDRHS